MPNRRSKSNHHLNAAAIVRRLPVHQQLSTSQSMIIKLSPSWLQWSKSDKYITNDIAQTLSLTNYKNGKLTIHCGNAVGASQLKHQQHTLLEYFHNKGFNEIEQIIVRIAHPTHLHSTQNNDQSNRELPNQAKSLWPASRPSIGFDRPSKSALESVKNCQKMIKNDRLSHSLRKLEQTLKSFDK